MDKIFIVIKTRVDTPIKTEIVRVFEDERHAEEYSTKKNQDGNNPAFVYWVEEHEVR